MNIHKSQLWNGEMVWMNNYSFSQKSYGLGFAFPNFPCSRRLTGGPLGDWKNDDDDDDDSLEVGQTQIRHWTHILFGDQVGGST